MVLAFVPFVSASKASGTLYTAPSGIAANCSVDATQALLTWIASVPDGTPPSPNTVQFAPNGCYQVNYPFRISGRNNLILDGNGATVRRFVDGLLAAQYPHGYKHFEWDLSTNITVENLHIQGTNTTPDNMAGECDPAGYGGWYSAGNEFESGFGFDQISGLLVTNVTTDATWGDGITLGGEGVDNFQNVVVSNSTFDRDGRQGITIATASNVLLDNVQILHSHASGIDFEDNAPGGSTTGVEIRNSYINSFHPALSAQGVDDASNVYVHNNTIKCSTNSWPWLDEGGNPGQTGIRQNWRVDNNILQTSLNSPTIMFTKTSGIEVNGNTSPASYSANPNVQLYPGVSLISASGSITIDANNFTGAGAVYTADSATGPVSACGNLILVSAVYDSPASCTPVANPLNPPQRLAPRRLTITRPLRR
jgi:hypothetical protein